MWSLFTDDAIIFDFRHSRYALLLNEFLKARCHVAAQQKQIEALAEGLQEMWAQLEVSKSAPHTVLND